MTWKDLLANGRVDAHQTSKKELDDLRSIVHRNLKDASLAGLSSDNRFGLAYEAALLLAKMTICCTGYRVKGLSAHLTTFTALELAMGKTVLTTARYFDRCRRKRNELSYDAAGVVLDSEADDILAKANEFQDIVESWIGRHHRPYRA